MNVNLYNKKDYDSEPRRRLQKNKANRRPLAGNPKHEILNPKQDESRRAGRAGFKKQSQCANAQEFLPGSKKSVAKPVNKVVRKMDYV